MNEELGSLIILICMVFIGMCLIKLWDIWRVGKKENEWYIKVSYFSFRDGIGFYNMDFNYWKEKKQKINGKQTWNFKKKQRKRSCA